MNTRQDQIYSGGKCLCKISHADNYTESLQILSQAGHVDKDFMVHSRAPHKLRNLYLNGLEGCLNQESFIFRCWNTSAITFLVLSLQHLLWLVAGAAVAQVIGADRPVMGRLLVRIPGSLGCMSKHPWARYWTLTCSWWHSFYVYDTS